MQERGGADGVLPQMKSMPRPLQSMVMAAQGMVARKIQGR